ncbi:hypothetical protein NE237_000080 [Protea cynaroides]|uniref:Uncharacterized protein n=1 Tax=Protea cynaroides TaxID=273540 RepID=A0A9Q0GL22_9MAGN|nr:hypothetical protein NE237_000080 [Protea cynaroides]
MSSLNLNSFPSLVLVLPSNLEECDEAIMDIRPIFTIPTQGSPPSLPLRLLMTMRTCNIRGSSIAARFLGSLKEPDAPSNGSGMSFLTGNANRMFS